MGEPQDMTDAFTEALQEVAEKTLGRQRNKKQKWVTDDALKLCDERRDMKHKLHAGIVDANEYRATNARVRKALREAKERWISDQCQSIEDNLCYNNTKKAFAVVKSLTKEFQPRACAIDDKRGHTLTESGAIASRWREYCQELYTCVPDTAADKETLAQLASNPKQEEDMPILRDEIEKAIKQLKDGKAAGVDNIPGELLKHGGEKVINAMTLICNAIWKTRKWPHQWTESIIIPIPKKGNQKKCENYRTISLISHTGKVLLRVILNRLQPQVEKLLAEEQAGFRPGRSTVEQIFNLRIICEKYRELNKELHHNFIDFKKAFDRVWHEGMWAVLEKHNISKSITDIIRALYDRSESTVQIGGVRSEPFHPTVGVRQGCPLSPCLFNLFLEQIMTESLEDFEGTVKIGGRNVSNLRFADDIDLIAGSHNELADLTLRLDTIATKYGMEISSEKSKILVMGTQDRQHLD